MDSMGLIGKSTVEINVAPAVSYEHNLDLYINAGYKFLDNAELCP
jgi:hypothetical protein